MPSVKKNTHHTPQMYLRRFAVDGLLMTQRTGHAAKPVGTPVVGVINHFYTLKTRDGGSDEVEDALAVLEGRAKTVFERIDDGHLPLTKEDKTVMAEFVGFQMCRGM